MAISTAQVWQEMSQKLRQFLRRRLADEQTAEDVLQETFRRIHNGLHILQESERLAAWVYRLAHRALIDHLRKDQVTRKAFSEPRVSQTTLPEENYNDVIGGWLAQMVQSLPDTYRTTVALAELEGLTQRQVSARLGLSLSGAKSRVQRGREQLKAKLLDCCHLEMDRRGNVVDYQPRQQCHTCCPPGSTATSCQPAALRQA